MLKKMSEFADARIEMMQAMLNASIVSQEVFKAFVAIAEAAEVETKDDDAWEAYKAQFLEEEEESEEEGQDDGTH